MAKKKEKVKTTYHNVPIPKPLVQEAQNLIKVFPFYRSHSELFIAGGRLILKELIDLYEKRKHIFMNSKKR